MKVDDLEQCRLDPPATNRRRIAAISLFWLLAAAFFWQPLFRGEVLMPLNPRAWQPWSAADPGWREDGAAGNPLMGRDALTLTYPWRRYNALMLSRREMPFWNPYIFAGYPHLAALQSNAIYPLAAVFDLWDPVAGIAAAMALHLGLAGTLMFLFLCRLRVGLAAATLGGALFELNGFFLVRMGAPSYVFSGIWAPLMLLGVDDLMRKGGWRSSWKVVLAACGSFLGGHPQIFVLVMLIGGGYALLLAGLERRVPPRRRAGRLIQIGLAAALGLGLAGVQLVPFLELVQETGRSPVDFSLHRRLALPPAALAQALVPDVFGHPVDGNYWLHAAGKLLGPKPEARPIWTWNYTGENLFTGVAPLVLALFALARLRSPVALYFGALAAFSLLVLFGAPGALRAAYELVPTFQHSRADRILYVYMVAVSVLAPLGWAVAGGWRADRIPSRATSWLARGLVVLPLAPALVQLLGSAEERAATRRFLAFAGDELRAQSDALLPQAGAAVAIALAAAGLLVAVRRWPRHRGWAWSAALVLIVVPLCRFGWRYNPTQKPPLFPDSPVIERLRQAAGELGRIARIGGNVLPPNLGQDLGFFDVQGASAAALASYARLAQAADPGAVQRQKRFSAFRQPAVLDRPLVDFLGAGLILGDRELPLPQLADFPADPGFRAYRNPGSLPRFFLVDRVLPYPTVEEGVRRFLSPEFEPRRMALVESSDADVLAAPESPVTEPPTRDAVRVVAYGAHTIELDVAAAGDRLLVSSEVDYPGWEVQVDGVRQPKVLVNTAFRGVRVAAGSHRVRFHFVPRSFYLGLGLTLLCAVGYLATLAAGRRRAAAGGGER